MSIISTYQDKEAEAKRLAKLHDNLEIFYELSLSAERTISKLKMVGTYDRYFESFGQEYMLADNITKGLKWNGYQVIYIPKHVTVVDLTFLENIGKDILIIGPGKLFKLSWMAYRETGNYIRNLIIACDISNLLNLGAIFAHSSLLETVEIYGSVYDLQHNRTKPFSPEAIEYTFAGCEILKSVVMLDTDYSRLKTLRTTFSGCKLIKEILFDGTGEAPIVDLGYSFIQCRSLEYLNLEHMDTKKCRFFVEMFKDCVNLTKLDLCDTFVPTEEAFVDNMFYGCGSLERLNLSYWSREDNRVSVKIFENCSNLKSTGMKKIDMQLILEKLKMLGRKVVGQSG